MYPLCLTKWSECTLGGGVAAPRRIGAWRNDVLTPVRGWWRCARGAAPWSVPPAGAVQILPGTTHRRGTPPAVVETDARTWLSLACGLLTWDEAVATSRVSASGERTDLGPYLPLV